MALNMEVNLELYLELNDYALTENKSIVIYKHQRSGYQIVEKKVPINKGIEEVNVMIALNAIKANTFPKLIDYHIKESNMTILMSRIDGVTFNQAIQMPVLMDKIIRNLDVLIFNCIESLKVIHNAGIVHRDIKPENLLVDMALNVTIVDFGSACFEKSKALNCTMVGTYGYMSPEMMFLGASIHFPTDYYGLGKSLLYLLKGAKNMIPEKQFEIILELCEIDIEKRKKNIERF